MILRQQGEEYHVGTTNFLVKLFPTGKTNTVRGKISCFQQQHDETLPEAWEHCQDYILECPHHEMENWLLMQIYYHGLSNSTHETMDPAAGGAFLSLTISQATAILEKMASNQGWSEERTRTHMRGGGMHQLKEVDMLAAKMDMLMKGLDERTIEKKEVKHIHDSSMTCEECGETRRIGTSCPELREDVNYIINNNYYYRPHQN